MSWLITVRLLLSSTEGSIIIIIACLVECICCEHQTKTAFDVNRILIKVEDEHPTSGASYGIVADDPSHSVSFVHSYNLSQLMIFVLLNGRVRCDSCHFSTARPDDHNPLLR